MARFFLPDARQNDKMIVDFSFDTPSFKCPGAFRCVEINAILTKFNTDMGQKGDFFVSFAKHIQLFEKINF